MKDLDEIYNFIFINFYRVSTPYASKMKKRSNIAPRREARFRVCVCYCPRSDHNIEKKCVEPIMDIGN